VIAFNLTYTADPVIGKLLATKEFRIALSYAINRDEIKESVFLGLGEARQAVPAPWHPYFPGKEWARNTPSSNPMKPTRCSMRSGWTKRDAQGIRLMANGKPLTIEINVVPAFGAWPDVGQLVARTGRRLASRPWCKSASARWAFSMRAANQLQTEVWNEDTTAFPFTGGSKLDPRNAPGQTLTLGPLFYKWLTTNGKEGVEPTEPLKRIMQLIDTARRWGTTARWPRRRNCSVSGRIMCSRSARSG
jgi:peptide/nickel transport system substrate-binding protein